MTNAKRQRRRILQLVDASKAAGGLRGRMLVGLLEDLSDVAIDETEALGLIQDLASARLVELIDRRSYLPSSVTVGADHLVVRITAEGTSLLAHAIAPHPLVEDPRQP